MKRELTVTEKIHEINFPFHEKDWLPLKRIAQILAIKERENGTFDHGHWWRGPLLYSLIASIRPRVVLEIGTGRGYGIFCIAKAVKDFNLQTRIYTLDILGKDETQEWIVDNQKGVQKIKSSLENIWNNYIESSITNCINFIKISSEEIKPFWEKHSLPEVDFFFVDANHDYFSVRLDVLSSISIASQNFSILFDDFTKRKNYGVVKSVMAFYKKLQSPSLEIIDLFYRDPSMTENSMPHQMAFFHNIHYPKDEYLSLTFKFFSFAKKIRKLLSAINHKFLNRK